MTIASKKFFLAVFILTILSGGIMAVSNDSNRTKKDIISGVYLEVWGICYSAFVQIEDMSDEEKN